MTRANRYGMPEPASDGVRPSPSEQVKIQRAKGSPKASNDATRLLTWFRPGKWDFSGVTEGPTPLLFEVNQAGPSLYSRDHLLSLNSVDVNRLLTALNRTQHRSRRTVVEATPQESGPQPSRHRISASNGSCSTDLPHEALGSTA